jgi:opacity protein-like surface antigen
MTCKHLSVAGFSALLIAVPLTAAGAADIAVKARPSSLQSSGDSWTGLYLGAEDGGVFGASNQIDNGPFGFGPTTPGYKTTGALAGGTVGYNLRTGNWVWGLEGDMSWTNVRGGAHEMAPFTTSTFVTQRRTGSQPRADASAGPPRKTFCSTRLAALRPVLSRQKSRERGRL